MVQIQQRAVASTRLQEGLQVRGWIEYSEAMADLDWSEALPEESERVEWKESGRQVEEILRAACALANDLGGSGTDGFIVLGVRNDGTTVGTDTSDEAIQRIASRLSSTKLQPNPSVSVVRGEGSQSGLLVIRVAPYLVPPVVRVDGVAWVRVGTTTRRASDADLARLQERRPENRLPFDQRAVAGASVEDLSVVLKEQYLMERAEDAVPDSFPDYESWLGQREILRHSEAGWIPTVAGVLIFGISPHRFVPGAVIEFVRYAGADYDSPVARRKTIIGSLPSQLDALWAQLESQVAEVPAPIEGIRSPFVPLYPLEGLKELARNLVQHRLYEGTNAPARVTWLDDRVVFNNPGARFGRASEGAFGDHSDYRNPTITRFLVELGYVERLGRGIRLVRKQLEKMGSPPLEAETDGFTTVTLRRPA